MIGDYLYWLFAIPGVLLGLYAQIKLSSTYSHFVKISNERGISGAEAARAILDQAGLPGMAIHETPGHLTDHYDPIKKALFLSSENYRGTSLSAVGVAAHEAGHALQHKAAYSFFRLRMALVPITQFASTAYIGIFILGMLTDKLKLALPIVVAAFAVITLFQLITLPVEYDASRRAKEQLLRLGLVSQREHGGVNKVLGAAALTYVAAMVTSMFQLLYFFNLSRSSDD